ncbi:uncharacterized protein LOC143550711 [Bidens hawaiensis]|uniref:uncharacterized protein LOC143550711 n=1 Tax=Bidens hawaiensis TaxID=980011 RepID=UPI00404B4220
MDARGHRGFTTYQKCTVALHQMGYKTTSDAWHGYLQMSERIARKDMYKFCQRGDHCHQIVALEAIASHDLWIWLAYFDFACSNNDLNVLDQSPLFSDIESGVAPDSSFEINGGEYKYG